MLPWPIYYALLIMCSTYALLKGGSPERVGALVLAAASIFSFAIVAHPRNLYTVEPGLFLVDAAMLIAFAVLALRVDRFWPIWISAFAGLGLLGHLGRWSLGPELDRRAYIISIVVWSYPMLAAIAIGTFNHHRRMRGTSADPARSN